MWTLKGLAKWPITAKEPFQALHEDLKEAIWKGGELNATQMEVLEDSTRTEVTKEAFAVAGIPITRRAVVAMSAERRAAKAAAEEALKALRTRRAVVLVFNDGGKSMV